MLTKKQREKIEELLSDLYVGGEVLVFDDKGYKDDAFVDDGSLHIRREEVDFCLDCDQMNGGDKRAERLLPKAVKLIDKFLEAD